MIHVNNPAAVVPVGGVVMWPTATPPTGWLIMDGSTFDAAAFPQLNTLLGGNTLPDMRQRFPIGQAASGTGSTLLGTGGAVDHVHSQPTHNHTIAHTHQVDPPNTTTGNNSASSGQLVGVIQVADDPHTHDVDIAAFTSGGSSAANSGNGGDENTGTNNPPFLALNFIIKAAVT